MFQLLLNQKFIITAMGRVIAALTSKLDFHPGSCLSA